MKRYENKDERERKKREEMERLAVGSLKGRYGRRER